VCFLPGFLDDLRRWLPQIAKSEPMAPAFWDDYYRETVSKLARQDERKHWWRALFAPRPMWMVPAFGTVGVAVLVVGLLFGRGNLSSFIQRRRKEFRRKYWPTKINCNSSNHGLARIPGKLEKQMTRTPIRRAANRFEEDCNRYRLVCDVPLVGQ
jgi:hypothetical protein